MKFLKAFIKEIRPRQWSKNIFVFSALIFAAKFNDFKAILLSILGFILFSAAASSVYLINDVIDYNADRNHPIKKNRPVAKGDISREFAVIASILIITIVFLISFFLNKAFFLVILFYYLYNIAYSLYLKNIVIIDIILVSLGFVLRAIGGVFIINVGISNWFLVIIFLLTLFISIVKRRQEIVEIAKNGGKTRKVLQHYSIEMLDQMISIITPSVLVSYIIFTFNTFHTRYFIFTIPFVVYGILRYIYIMHKKDLGENPTETLFFDLPLLVDVLIWGGLSISLIYFFEILK